jgi:DNA mismatch endonuclease (patch repair protein)
MLVGEAIRIYPVPVDRLTPQQRSALMAKVRSYDTGPERQLRSALHALGLRFRKHVAHLRGSPDVVFVAAKVAVFVDGDFWHGYRYPAWRLKLAPYWQQKIERNRARDRRTFACLRQQGWAVVRVWEHQLRPGATDPARRIARLVKARTRGARR